MARMASIRLLMVESLGLTVDQFNKLDFTGEESIQAMLAIQQVLRPTRQARSTDRNLPVEQENQTRQAPPVLHHHYGELDDTSSSRSTGSRRRERDQTPDDERKPASTRKNPRRK